MDPVCFAFAAPLPVAWLEGDILAEYLLFLEETVPPPPPSTGVPVAWLEGEVGDEFLLFLEESRRQEEKEEEQSKVNNVISNKTQWSP